MTVKGGGGAAGDGEIAAFRRFEGDLRRQQRIGWEARGFGARGGGRALGGDRDERAVGLAGLAAQVEPDAGAGVAGHVEHQFEPGAGTHRKLGVERLERLARLAVDRNDEGFHAVDRDRRQAGARGVCRASGAPARRAGR